MAPDGTAVTPLAEAEIERIIACVRAAGVEAVAVSLLHAYANDAHERALGEALESARPGLFVTLSSDVCREFREYERTSTAAVNAFIGPVVRRYIDDLGADLRARDVDRLSIVKSNGGLTSAANARRYPVHLIESGPAAGIIAAAALGRVEELGDLIAFDMGGTTAKVGVVIGGQPRLSTEFHADRFVDGVDVGGYPIQSPVIDLIEIGAGGGSLARLDAQGVIKVGPESAGADPGPACYGRGGERPTVTDAHVALGHIAADGFGGEDLSIDPTLAAAAIERQIAGPLGWPVARAAWGILRLATANMAEMVRLATLRRGLDPRDFSLVAFGGAGPLHAGEIAREVGIPRVVVPPVPGLFSAIGTLMGRVRHDLVQTMLRRASELRISEVTEAFAQLDARAERLIRDEDAGSADWRLDRAVDARFEGQLFELTLPLPAGEVLDGGTLDRMFRAAYRETYGYDLPDHTVQLVNLRLVAESATASADWPKISTDGNGPAARRRDILDDTGLGRDVPVRPRAGVEPGTTLTGPLIIEDLGATILVLAGQTVQAAPSGVLIIAEEEHAP